MWQRLWDHFDSIAWSIAGPAVLVLTGYPITLLLFQMVSSNKGFTLDVITQVLGREQYYQALFNTLVVSTTATLLSVVIGTLLAWMVGRVDIPGRSWLRVGLTIPYLIPAFIFAFAWQQILGQVGYLNKILFAITGNPEPFFSIYGPGGIILTFVLHGYPLVYLATLGALENMSPALEEAAETAGAGTWQTMRDVTLPLVAPAIGAGAILTFTDCIANFGIPAILGSPTSYYVLTTRIYSTILSYGTPNNLAIAAVLSFYLVVVGAIALGLQSLYFGRRRFTVITGKSGRRGLVRIGVLRWPLAAIGGAVFLLGTIAPLAAILLNSLIPGYGQAITWETLSLNNYVLLFTQSFSRVAARNSLFLAISAATLCTLLALLVAYLAGRTELPLRRAIAALAGIPRAIPGTILALGFILAWIRPIPILGFSIYSTIWILLLAYVCKFLALSERTVTASLQQVSSSLEDAVLVSGGSRGDALRDILVPLVKPSLIAGWLLVFVPAFNDLTISALLYSSGSETIGVAVFTLIQEGYVTTASALAVLIIASVLLGDQILKATTRGRISLLS